MNGQRFSCLFIEIGNGVEWSGVERNVSAMMLGTMNGRDSAQSGRQHKAF